MLVATTTVLLQILLREGESFGLDLAARVSRRTQKKISLHQGSLYPALKDLKLQGLVRSRAQEGEHGGRPRRYYALTAAGKKVAKEQAAVLKTLIEELACDVTVEEERLEHERYVGSLPERAGV